MLHHIIALILFCFIALFGLLLTFIGIGGTFVVFIAALLYNLISWSMTLSWTTLGWLLGLAVLGELLEYVITLVGIRIGRVSYYGLYGAIAGALIGAFALSFIPVFGTIIGIVIGTIIGAFLCEYYFTLNMKKSWKVAKAAFYSRMAVSLAKFLIAVVQIVIVLNVIS